MSARERGGKPIAIAALLLAGCRSPVDAEQAQAQARTIFMSRCSNCHGEQGRGDGPAGKVLEPPPRSFRDPAWQARTSDEDIARIIVHGGAAIGKSSLMPANLDLHDEPETVAALVAIIRGFREP